MLEGMVSVLLAFNGCKGTQGTEEEGGGGGGTLVCSAACSGLLSCSASSRKAVASRTALRCRKRSVMVISSMGGPGCLATIFAKFTCRGMERHPVSGRACEEQNAHDCDSL